MAFARANHIGWIHLWRTREAFEVGEASEHFLNPRIDPLWRETDFAEDVLARLAKGELVELEDPGYLDAED